MSHAPLGSFPSRLGSVHLPSSPSEASDPSGRHPVVLLGSDCLTGLQIARILWRRGVPVVGIAENPTSPYCRTRAVQRTLAAPDESAFRSLLDDLCATHGRAPLLLPCTDHFAEWLSLRRDPLEGRGRMLLPSADTLDLLANKARFSRYAKGSGCPSPESWVVEELDELMRAAEVMHFPIVMKPARRNPEWDRASAGLKVRRFDNGRELGRDAPALLAAAGQVVLQAWVPGPDSQSRELTVLHDSRGECLAEVVLQKVRQWPPGIGTGSLVFEVEDPEVLEAGRKLIESIEFVGLGQIEFKRDIATGELYVIEMNPGRAALNQPLCEAAGVEITWAWYCAAAGLPVPEDLTVKHRGAGWVCWKRDFRSAFAGWRRGDLSLLDWARSYRDVRRSADIQLSDPLPFAADITTKIASALRRRLPDPTGSGDIEPEGRGR